MKFPKLTALVPEGEHFDESAIINEGCYLSIGHINAVEAAFVSHDTVVGQFANLTTAHEAVQNELTAAQTAATAQTEELATANARIQELEGTVATLKTKPAAEFKETVTEGDLTKEGVPAKSKYYTSIDEEAQLYIRK